jgi:hypothetical protein
VQRLFLPRYSPPSHLIRREVTGRGTAGHVARIVQDHPLHASSDSKVLTLTEEWLQVLLGWVVFLCFALDVPS